MWDPTGKLRQGLSTYLFIHNSLILTIQKCFVVQLGSSLVLKTLQGDLSHLIFDRMDGSCMDRKWFVPQFCSTKLLLVGKLASYVTRSRMTAL